MTLADIVDNSFRLFKANWRQIALVVLIFSIPTMVLSVVTQAQGGQSITELFNNFSAVSDGTTAADEPWTVLDSVTAVIGTVIWLLVQPFILGVITRLVAASYLGQRIDARESARGLLGRWIPFVVADLLVVLTIIGATFIVAIPVGILAYAISSVFAVLLVFALIPIVLVSVMLALVVPVIAVEETGPARALSRSWALMKPRFWPYLGTFIVMIIVVMVGATFFGAVTQALVFVANALWEPLAYPFVVLDSFVSNLTVLPISSIAVTLIYFDARIRNEGFDLEIMAAQLPNGTPEK